MAGYSLRFRGLRDDELLGRRVLTKPRTNRRQRKKRWHGVPQETATTVHFAFIRAPDDRQHHIFMRTNRCIHANHKCDLQNRHQSPSCRCAGNQCLSLKSNRQKFGRCLPPSIAQLHGDEGIFSSSNTKEDAWIQKLTLAHFRIIRYSTAFQARLWGCLILSGSQEGGLATTDRGSLGTQLERPSCQPVGAASAALHKNLVWFVVATCGSPASSQAS